MKIQQHAWSEEAKQGLGETLRDCEGLLHEQVNAGVAQLWLIDDHSWMITRLEQWPDKKELVVCCYKGKYLNAVTQMIMDSAKRQGIDSIRYHTQRPALNRLVSDLGFEYMETIFHKDLSQAHKENED